jgi:drug/metabolite transporter (DMT)-like permease
MKMFSGTAFLALLVAMLLWGSSFVAFKYAVMVYDPIAVVFARMVLSSLLFLCVLPLWRPQTVLRKDVPLMVFMAVCEPCLYFLFEGYALTLTSASQAGMVAATLPVLVAVCAGIFLGERLAPRSWAGLVLALVGVTWVSVSGNSTETAPRPVLGNFLELLGMLCAAGYTVSMKKLCASYSPWFLTAVQSFAGSVFFLPLLLLPSTTLPTSLPVGPTLAVVYLGVCISIGAYGLYNYGISKLPAWQASAFINLIPVFSILLGWICLGEQTSLTQFFGMALVLGGVLMSQHRPRKVDAPARE